MNLVENDNEPSQQQQEVLSLLARWQQYLSAKKLDELCSLYADDAALWGTFISTQRITNTAIRSYFEELLHSQSCKVHFLDSYLRCFDNTAICSGLYSFILNDDDFETEVMARFSMTFHQRNGQWLIVEHHSSRRDV